MRELKYKQIWYGGDTTDEVINIPSNMLLIKTPNKYDNSQYIYENAEHYCGICKLIDELPEFEIDEEGCNIIDEIGGDIFNNLGLIDWTNIILSDECKDLVITPEEAVERFQLNKYYIVRFLKNGCFESIYNIQKIYNYSHMECNCVSTKFRNQKFIDYNTEKDINYLEIIDGYKLTLSGFTEKNCFVTVCNSDDNPYIKELFHTLVKYVTDLMLQNKIDYEIPDVDYCMRGDIDINNCEFFDWFTQNLNYLYLKQKFPLKKNINLD